MSWFVYAVICILGWGCADLFYKMGSETDDRYSHLKTAVWVGLVMGVCSVILIPFAETEYTPASLIEKAAAYSPASICYIISMIIGYAGLRYLELSIVSPVQNASGALSMICMLIWFSAAGRIGSIGDEFSGLDIIGTLLITAGFIALAVVEQKISRNGNAKETAVPEGDKRYITGALALIFPFMYCLFDTLGTAADGIILDEETGLGLGEIDVIVLYGLTFLLAGIICEIIVSVRTGKIYDPFARSERPKMAAAVCEEFGQVFYVYAMAARPVLAAPMVASYCIVSVLLSRVLLKEKLKTSQYICVISVIIGIVILGISEGLAEALP